MKSIWTTLLLVVLFASFFTMSCAAVYAPRSTDVASFQRDLYASHTSQVGNMYINGSQTYSIDDREFSVAGTILVQDQATLDVENATLDLTPPSGTYDVLKATDMAQVHIINSTIKLAFPGTDLAVIFSCYDQSEMDMTGSRFEGDRFEALAYNSSIFTIENINTSTLSEPCSAAMYGNSSLKIENSYFQYADAYDNSAVYVTNDSHVLVVNTGWDQGQTTVALNDSTLSSNGDWGKGSQQYTIKNSTVISALSLGPNSVADITGSSIGSELEARGNSTATLEDSAVYWVETYDNSTITLTRSTWSKITTEGNSKVLVGNWFFGESVLLIASVPYTWVVPIEIAFIAAVIMAIGALVLEVRAIRLKKRDRRAEMHGK